MTQANYIDDLINMSDPPDTSNCQSEVVKFYTGKNILITGASGLLGVLLTERILRCCPDVNKVYIFIREKKNKTVQQRFDEYFDDVIYDRLKKEQPDFKKKVVMIEADMAKDDLGLSVESRECLLETNIIFHLAANMRFNETLRNAVNTNVRGTKELILFAKKMSNFQAFVYVSTAFSFMHTPMEEKYYPPPLSTEKILALLDSLQDDMLDKIHLTLLDQWPNVYAYTKAIAEDTVREYSVGIQACIVRPSIVITTVEEPVAGWINNIYGAVGATVGTALGLIHTINCVGEYVADLVPADFVIANIIVAAWDIAQMKDQLLSLEKTNTNISDIERVPIYNYVSSCENPVTWKTFMDTTMETGAKVGCTKSMWHVFLFLNSYKFNHDLCVFFLHMIPGAIVDFLAVLSGRKAILLKMYKKINTFNNVIAYFSVRKWEFRNDAVVKLWDRLNPADRQIFKFSMLELDWTDCLQKMIYGLRIYIAKDSLDTVEKARKRYKRLKYIHYTLVTILFILLMWGILYVINLIF